MVTLTTILDKTVSPDPKELKEAQEFLEQAAEANLAEFFHGLCQVLSDPSNSDVSRMAAGLQIKNHITAKDAATKEEKHRRWLAIHPMNRNEIKKLVLQALGTETNRPSSVAQVIAGIAGAEIPLKGWEDLIRTLVQHVANPQSTEHLKEAALEAIGYICADIEPSHLQEHSNEILTAIVQGMRKEEPSNAVKLAATTALFNSLEFTKENFDRETERHFIMQVICEATQSPDMRICVSALQCLVKIMSLYYIYMEAYMAPALFAITMGAMKSEEENICLQGIEFWSNVCDEEIDLAIELSEAEEQGQPPERTSKFYAKGALQYLCPELLKILAKQDDMDDEDDWNPSKAAGVCLMLLASCCENDVIEYAVPFINNHINSPDWKLRDAAIMALGSILEGPSPEVLAPLVESKIGECLKLLQDQSVIVRDTTAWAIGRICELIPNAVINEKNLMPLLKSMVEALDMEPRVATNICWAFTSLAEAAYEAALDDQDEAQTYCMSSVYEQILGRLLMTTDRSDGHQNNLRSAAYEAVMEMVKNSPKDCYGTVYNTIQVVMERIEKLLAMEPNIKSSSDRSQYNDLQSLLCATLQSVMRKAEQDHIRELSDKIMSSLLLMMDSSSGNGGVQEDAMLAVGTLTEVVGEKFWEYFPHFKPFLYAGLRNHSEYQVCIVAVGIVGDICRAVGSKIESECDDIMTILLEDLSNQKVHRSVKPHILSAFGDIALAIGPVFKKYLVVVLDTLQQAAQAQVDKADYDMVDYLNELREGCLEAYTGIIQGLKGDGKDINEDVFLVKERIIFMLSFVEAISADEDRSEAAVSASSGLVGDLCTAFGPSFGPHLVQLFESKPRINDLLTEGRRSKNSKTKSLATWATKEMRKLRNKA